MKTDTTVTIILAVGAVAAVGLIAYNSKQAFTNVGTGVGQAADTFADKAGTAVEIGAGAGSLGFLLWLLVL